MRVRNLALVQALLVIETGPLVLVARPLECVYHLLVFNLIQAASLLGLHVAWLHGLLSEQHLAGSPENRLQILLLALGGA